MQDAREFVDQLKAELRKNTTADIMPRLRALDHQDLTETEIEIRVGAMEIIERLWNRSAFTFDPNKGHARIELQTQDEPDLHLLWLINQAIRLANFQRKA